MADTLGTEILRLVKLARNVVEDDLLTQALAGRERDSDNVMKLFAFVAKNIGADSQTAEKLWVPVEKFLKEYGVDELQLVKIRYPYPRPGEKGFRSVLDEFREQGWEI